MKRILLFSPKTVFFFTFFISQYSIAQKLDSLKINELSELVVKSTRANNNSAMAFTNVFKKDIEKINLGQDLPFLLNQLPSVVVSSDAGAGVGYTGIRIRGTDPTRVNVTLNGIPYNDSESQGVYWVNMPDFASSVQSIQVQRGVGTSTNGAGAFGGSVNVNTLQLNHDAFSEINFTTGSFNTFKTNILASTGFLNDHFVLDARLSKIASDGFVDRAASDLKSYYVSAGYYLKSSFIRFNIFSGQEKTYQSWNGIPQALAKNDLTGIDDFVSRNYYDDSFKNNMLSRGRKFNFYNYDNEIDNYTQTHYQLISSISLGNKWRFNPTLHYTKGQGYYEQYKSSQKFSSYGLSNVKIGNDEIKRTDLIRRKWLDNDFYGAVWSFDYESDNKLSANIGGGWNKYEGAHFGEVIWSKYASNSDIRYRYYDNDATKSDFNIYAKAYYNLNSKITSYLDLQVRTVNFDMFGLDDNRLGIDYNKKFAFFNPKAGLTYNISKESNAYLSYAVGNKEPSRQDFVDNPTLLPKPENLQDIEMGYKFMNNKMSLDFNYYYMLYKNQLVLTGQINDVGNGVRVNVDNSFRTGLEMQMALIINSKINFAANLTLSKNQIKQVEEFIPSYDDSPNVINNFKNTDIAFSPNIIAGNSINFLPFNNFEFSILQKYVGSQFLDNTSSETRKLDAFFVNDIRLSYNIKTKFAKNINLSLLVNNVLNYKYESNGYTYSYIFGGPITENFVFPQAGINFLTAIKIRF